MSTATLPAVNGANQGPTPIDPATLEKVVLGGDLSKLTSAERITWFRARCEAAGLDPRTQPFQYLSLQGRLTLYATKAATDQLISNHQLTVEIPERRHDTDLGIYEVRCRVTFPSGRHVEDLAALSIAGLKGEALCNAVMKAVTKAKRRTVLSACGLGILDESEVETIPGAVPQPVEPVYEPPPSNDSGHGRLGAYASTQDVNAYEVWLQKAAQMAEMRIADAGQMADGSIVASAPECPSYRLSRHLLKTAVATGVLNAPGEDKLKSGQVNKLVAVWFARDPAAVRTETAQYVGGLCLEARHAAVEATEGPHVDSEEADDREPGSEG